MRLDFDQHGVTADGTFGPFARSIPLDVDGYTTRVDRLATSDYLVTVRNGQALTGQATIPSFVHTFDGVGPGQLNPPVDFAVAHLRKWARSCRIVLHAQVGQAWSFYTTDAEPQVNKVFGRPPYVRTDGQITCLVDDPSVMVPGLPPNHEITGATYAIIISRLGDRVLRYEIHLGPGVGPDQLKDVQMALVSATDHMPRH